MTKEQRQELTKTVEIPFETVVQLRCTMKDYRDECYATECAVTRVDIPVLTDEEYFS